MDVKTHDLIKVKGLPSFLDTATSEEWVKEAIIYAPFVVVRRAPIEKGKIPIGVRGAARNQRYAAFLDINEVEAVFSPEMLANQKGWIRNKRFNDILVLQDLSLVDDILTNDQLTWGPVGSAGFELASGLPTLTMKSDLDLIIRLPYPLLLEKAKQLYDELSEVNVRIDVQLETPSGSVALAEYCRGQTQLLLRTNDGPVLTRNPWQGISEPLS
ncbi:malonate decarboxylase holo-ACP synthase [Alkalihalobacillus deserti]|uniref:malonate decarboxylase holo-ACP synthase n=1 Tax=Alkalihalobacillus deserti TaxID=2879466 RepID=UPI001D148877|nr:malonate decarboxylase holo-ACP synthase [Alkalihalobacillus deserti]